MTDEAPAGGIAIEPAADTGAELSIADAARAYVGAVTKKPDEPAESAEPATAETESASNEADAAPPEEATGETQEEAPAETPPRELPRSWTKDRTEHWNKLDPDTQDFLLEQDRKASAEVRRVQNDAAEKLKGLTAKEQQVEQVRQHYEAKIKVATEVLEREQLRDFPDIKTMADVERMAAEDPFRKIQWDVHQQKMQAVAWEASQAETRKAREQQTEWTNYVQTENARAAELIPELADKIKGPVLTQRAADRLGELGFKPEELNDLASGKTKLSIYDHRIQQLIFSDLKLADIQKAKTVVAAKPIPLVQRPGTAKPAGSVVSEQIQALTRKLEQTGETKDAVALYEAQQRAQRRAS